MYGKIRYCVAIVLLSGCFGLLSAAGGERESGKAIAHLQGEGVSLSPELLSDPQQRSAVVQGRSGPRMMWSFSRVLRNTSSSREYPFEIEPCVRRFTLSIYGSCRSGVVNVKIEMPDGKAYSGVSIDKEGNVRWRRSFDVNDDTKERVGEWKFIVTTDAATGSFRLNMQAF